MRYLGFDIETGGLDSNKHTVMEAYFSIWEDDFTFVDDLHLLLKRDDGTVIAEEEALKITGMNVEEHLANPNTVTYSEGEKLFLKFLEKNKIPGKRKSFRPLGQNIIAFDIPFIQNQKFISKQNWDKSVHHNAIDTTVITTFLKDIGVFPDNVGSLSSLVEYFGMQNTGAHRAKSDVHMQKDVYVHIQKIMKKHTSETISTATPSILKVVEW